jgi:hypothetical protein
MSHGNDKVWMVEPLEGMVLNDEQLPYPHSQFLSEGNGGEMRKSYHGYPRGYAQLIQSPDTFTPVPMQIDTWNRRMDNATFITGPLPRSSRIRDGVAGYNPLLECPCSDRLVKEWKMTYYTTDPTSFCHHKEQKEALLQNATECFVAATQLISSHHQVTTHTTHDPSKPAGCTVSMDQNGSLHIEWNSYNNKNKKKNNPVNITIEAPVTSLLDQQPAIVGVATGVVNVTIVMNQSTSTVTITLSGPNDRWFGK